MADNENDDVPVARPSKAEPITAGDPVEEIAVTGRPQDDPEPNTTFADRAKANSGSKAVDSDATENKSVAPAKAARKRK